MTGARAIGMTRCRRTTDSGKNSTTSAGTASPVGLDLEVFGWQ